MSGLSWQAGRRLEMESRVRVLELEQSLATERLKLAALRRTHYRLEQSEVLFLYTSFNNFIYVSDFDMIIIFSMNLHILKGFVLYMYRHTFDRLLVPFEFSTYYVKSASACFSD